jgi:hypothetical protein
MLPFAWPGPKHDPRNGHDNQKGTQDTTVVNALLKVFKLNPSSFT